MLNRQSPWITTLAVICLLLLPLLLVACASEQKIDDPNYYTGPMKPKNSGQQSAAGTE